MSAAAVGAGSVLSGRYRLAEPLASGGMGTVWRATDLLLNREVAVKEVRLPPGLDPEARQMLRRRTIREAQAAARLRHPAIVTVYDIVEQDDRPWIVMELVPSQSLADIIRTHGPLPPAQVAAIGLRILDAMVTAQAAGVQHRDIKPANVLITEDGRVVLTDFGIARHVGDETLTSAGLLVGSPDYLAPERARGLPSPGLAADLWSLGATMYDAVEGHRPFERAGPLPTLAAVVMDEPPPPRRAGPLRPVIDALLVKNPAHRLDADQTRTMLQRVIRGRSPGATMRLPIDPPTLTEHPPGETWPATGGAPAGHAMPPPPAAPSPAEPPTVVDVPVAPAPASGRASGPAAAGVAGSAAAGGAAPAAAGGPAPPAVGGAAPAAAGGPAPAPAGGPAPAAVGGAAPAAAGGPAPAPAGGPAPAPAGGTAPPAADGAAPPAEAEEDGDRSGETGQAASPAARAAAAAAAAGAAAAGMAGVGLAGAAATERNDATERQVSDRPAAGTEPRGTAEAAPRGAAATVSTGSPAGPVAGTGAPVADRSGPERTAVSRTGAAAAETATGAAAGAAAAGDFRTTPAERPTPGRESFPAGPGLTPPDRGHTGPDREGTLPGPDRTGTPRRTGGGRRRTLIGAALAALILAAAALILPHALSGDGSPPAAGRTSQSPGTANGTEGTGGTGAPASPTGAVPSAGQGSGASRGPGTNPGPSRAPGRTAGAPAATGANLPVPAGFRRYTDPQDGFSVVIPVGWQPRRLDTRVDFDDPNSGRFLRIDTTDTPKDDPYLNWIQYEEVYSQGKTNYENLGIRRVPSYRPEEGWSTADWEFTIGGTHVLDRNIRVSSARAHAIYWSTPSSLWGTAESRRIFDLAAASFVPAPVGR